MTMAGPHDSARVDVVIEARGCWIESAGVPGRVTGLTARIVDDMRELFGARSVHVQIRAGVSIVATASDLDGRLHHRLQSRAACGLC
jgi:hypothetical protein